MIQEILKQIPPNKLVKSAMIVFLGVMSTLMLMLSAELSAVEGVLYTQLGSWLANFANEFRKAKVRLADTKEAEALVNEHFDKGEARE